MNKINLKKIVYKLFIVTFLLNTLLPNVYAGGSYADQQLMQAVDQANSVGISEALRRGAKVNCKRGKPLWQAHYLNHRNIVRQLLLEGANPNIGNSGAFQKTFRSWFGWFAGESLRWYTDSLLEFSYATGRDSDLLVIFGARPHLTENQGEFWKEYFKKRPLETVMLQNSSQALEEHLRQSNYSYEEKGLALSLAIGLGLENSVEALMVQGTDPEAIVPAIGLSPAQIATHHAKRVSQVNSGVQDSDRDRAIRIKTRCSQSDLKKWISNNTLTELQSFLTKNRFSIQTMNESLVFAIEKRASESIRALMNFGADPHLSQPSLNGNVLHVIDRMIERHDNRDQSDRAILVALRESLERPGYYGSEAMSLRNLFRWRRSGSEWLDYTVLNGKRISVSGLPSSNGRIYQIDPTGPGRDLIGALRVEADAVGATVVITQGGSLTLSEADLTKFSDELQGTVTELLIDRDPSRRVVKFEKSGLNPVFTLREWARGQTEEIARIQNKIEAEVREHETEFRGFWMNNSHRWGYKDRDQRETGPFGIFLYDNEFDRATFDRILEAIRTGNEKEFVFYAIQFASSFPRSESAMNDSSDARQNFIKDFSTLFVTQSFPSKGAFLSYSHFVGHCGQIF